MKSDFLVALTQMAAERHLPREQVLSAVEVALASAFRKDNPATGQNISVTLNPNTGEVSVYALKTVVDAVEDPDREIALPDARQVKNDAELGEEIAPTGAIPYIPSRIAAQTTKQVVLQRLREAERELLLEEFLQHRGDIITGVVEQVESNRSVTLDLGRGAQAIMSPDDQVPTERYKKGQRIKVYVLDVRSGSKGPEIIVSRSDRDMLRRLFEIEVPEVYNGTVAIKSISRDAGFRSKVAVQAAQEGIDPVGACIGLRGNRIQSIVNELQGEKIDVVPWEPDPKDFIARAISPSEVAHVELFPEEQTATVIVPDRQLSLAIGREGQNARLAARLVGWRLDIKGLAEWEEIQETRRKEAEEQRRQDALAATAAGRPVVEAAATDEPETAAVAEQPASAAAETPEPAAPELPAESTPAAAVAATDTIPAAETVAAAETETAALPELAGTDEESLLEAMIREEEQSRQSPADTAETLSVADLETFTLDAAPEEPEEDESFFPDLPEVPILTPDAGKIRFAEDLVSEYRSGSRSGRRSRRSGAGGGNNRGGPRGGR